jgi:hypothetical protein
MYVASRAHAMRARIRTGGGTGAGRGRGSQRKSRKTFFAKKVVGLMLQPLTLRKWEGSASTLSSGMHIKLKCNTST